MRIDCHTHTTRYSSCSILHPKELCALAVGRGLDAVVITEHGRQWGQDELALLRADFPDLAIFSGVEISLREGYDVICLTGDTLLDLPQFPTLSCLKRAISPHRSMIFTFVAHPFRFRNFMTPELAEILKTVEGIEMNSVNILKRAPHVNEGRYRAHNAALYDEARKRYGLVPLFNSDAHAPQGVATIANELPGPNAPRDCAELAALLRAAPPQEWQNPQQIEEALDRYEDI